MRNVFFIIGIALFVTSSVFAQAVPLDSAQRRHIELRYGALMHFSYNTFVPGWGENIPDAGSTGPLAFHPMKLNCGQWAKIFKAAKMQYAIITSKHHDGFAIWPTAAVPPNGRPLKSVATSGIAGRDVLKEYADSMRVYGLKVGIYYSMWDANHCGWGSEYNVTDITGRVWSAAESTFVTKQITELMSNYGEICVFMVDGWDWTLGHRFAPYSSIRKLVKRLQPNCLMVDMNCLMSPWEVDMVFVEEPKGAPVYAPVGNVFPMCQSPTISGGWFARDNSNIYTLSALMTQASIQQHLADLEPRYCNLLLNVPPDTNGLITPACSTRLMQVAAVWSPNTARKMLPKQMHNIEFPVTPTATGTASSTYAGTIYSAGDSRTYTPVPYFAFNGLTDCWGNGNPWLAQTIWESGTGLPQWVQMDLGRTYDSLNIFGYLPRQDLDATTWGHAGSITQYHLLLSTNGTTFDTVVKNASWYRVDSNGNNVAMTGTERNYRIVEFSFHSARYVRLVALSTVNVAGTGAGTFATVSEMNIGTCPLHTASAVNNRVAPSKLALADGAMSFLLYGNRFRVPDIFAGMDLRVAVYDLSGKFLFSAPVRNGIAYMGKTGTMPAGVHCIKVTALK